MSTPTTLDELLTLLRDKESGCPWSREQTLESIVPHTLEEAYEVAAAIHSGDKDAILDEVSDLLLQVHFYAKIAEEKGWFDSATIEQHAIAKQLARKPHLHTDESLTAAEAEQSWQQIKSQETHAAGILAKAKHVTPALTRAYHLGRLAATVGFDWSVLTEVFAKVQEEIVEAKEVCVSKLSPASHDAPSEKEYHEIGDVLFTVVNLARHCGVCPELALTQACERYINRFEYIEEKVETENKTMASLSFEEQLTLWAEAKTKT